jgi:flagellar M-ring protein FliF
MLERVAGPGQAIISVDATLNFDQITRTLQSVVPVGQGDSAGGVARRRESRTRAAPNTETTTAGAANDSSSLEVEYEFGKRLEQVATAPGALVRLSIGVVVPGSLTPERESRLLQLVRVSAGIDAARGDTVIVDSLDRITGPNSSSSPAQANSQPVPIDPASDAGPNSLGAAKTLSMRSLALAMVALLVALAAAMFVALWWRNSRELPASAKEKLLAEIVATLEGARSESVKRI